MYPVATITDAQKSKPAVIEIDLRASDAPPMQGSSLSFPMALTSPEVSDLSQGKLTVTFARHGETHVATSLPRIVLTRPAGAPSWGLFELSLSGSLELECQARGLRASLTLRPGGVVAGTIERLAGATFQRQCRVSGTLALGVVALREGRGDAHPVLARQAPWPQVDLARIGCGLCAHGATLHLAMHVPSPCRPSLGSSGPLRFKRNPPHTPTRLSVHMPTCPPQTPAAPASVGLPARLHPVGRAGRLPERGRCGEGLAQGPGAQHRPVSGPPLRRDLVPARAQGGQR